LSRRDVAASGSEVLPTPERPGDAIAVAARDGDCPAGTMGVADYDSGIPGAQNTVIVPGGAKKVGRLPVTGPSGPGPNAKSSTGVDQLERTSSLELVGAGECS
jgi:hypothetical protein